MKEGIQDKIKECFQKAKSNVEKYVLPWWRKLRARVAPVINTGKQKAVKGFCVCRDWTCANWQSGRNGQIKVLAAGGALLLVIGTVFSMAGSRPSTSGAKLSKEYENEPMAVAHDSDGESKSDAEEGDASEADQELGAFAALLAAGRDNQEMRGWMCSYKDCCAIYYSPTKPYGSMGGPCGHGASHFWLEKGSAGSTTYRCNHCGLTMQMSETPWSAGECPRGVSHFWIRQY